MNGLTLCELNSFFDLLTQRNNASEAPLSDDAVSQRGTSDLSHSKIFAIKLASFGNSSYLCQRKKNQKYGNVDDKYETNT